jgi:tetratricopeptide (TPR) repeat protein
VLRRVSRFALVVAIAGGCVRAPAPLDVNALVRVHGEAGARGELEVRVLDSPRDVQARLALARLAEKSGRPSQAIEQLEAVLRLGGPLGTRWHDDDRARFARLLLARGMVRLARSAATALADLERAKSHGAAVDDVTLAKARSFAALDQLRHVDGRTRAKGQKAIAELRGAAFADPSWVGALTDATPRDRGLFGVWLWGQGAKRAAFESLAAWRASTAERDAATSTLHAAYLRALAWWTPLEGARPPEAELVGVERCRFVACSAAAILDEKDPARRGEGVAAILAGPFAPTTNGADAAAWAAITLEVALFEGEPWGALLARRVNIGALDLATVPAFARPIFARLAGRPIAGVGDDALAALAPWQRLLVAADRVLAGASRAQVIAALPEVVATPGVRPIDGQVGRALGDDGYAVLAILEPPALAVTGDAHALAIQGYLARRGFEAPQLAAIVVGYRRDPAVAERRARDFVAQAPDAAIAHAALGMLWSLLDDPARARAAWQAAVDSSPEPAFVRGLAEAVARAGDPDAAMVHGFAAAAAHGDPAVVWTQLSRSMHGVGNNQHAIEAARSAIDLASRDELAPALDAGIAASRGMGRAAQADALAARRAKLAAPIAAAVDADAVDAEAALRADDDPTDARGAIAVYQQRSTAIAVARMWIASRWNPRDVAIRGVLLDAIALDDPRRALLVAELVSLAASPDDERGRAAIRVLSVHAR